MNKSTPVISVRGLHKSFGSKKVVDNFSLDLFSHKIVGFLGPNGSGKTTTIRMLCGLLKPDSGEGECLGQNLFTSSARLKSQIGYMTQKFSFWEDLTVYENLKFVASVYQMPEINSVVEETLKKHKLKERAHQLAGSLSGGWKQRLALAAATLHKPKILLLDEPTAGVDPQARRDFWDSIYDLAAEGLTILVSTHYMDEAERCHEIVYMVYGVLIAQGSPQDLIYQSGLKTLKISGSQLYTLHQHLKNEPEVISAPFGNTLHLSSKNHQTLENLLSDCLAKGYQGSFVSTALEDVLIYHLNSREV